MKVILNIKFYPALISPSSSNIHVALIEKPHLSVRAMGGGVTGCDRVSGLLG